MAEPQAGGSDVRTRQSGSAPLPGAPSAPRWLTRTTAFGLVLCLWGTIYLPRLGYNELQGEEGRRALPAIHMLQTGRWIVPVVGGEDYYNKPPGINWLVAASFALTGRQDELAARLPSVVFILAFVSLLVLRRGPWLPLPARLAGAVVFLTTAAMMEKGRLIEIEAVYVSLTGLAVLWWLDCWCNGSSRWSLWLAPCLLLALGALVKGPFLGLVFYATVLCVTISRRRVRELFTIQHLVGICIILVLCLGWVYLAKQQTDAARMTGRWSSQIAMRLLPESIDYGHWALNILRGLPDFLPWLIFVPLLWMKRFTANIAPERLGLFNACRLAMVIGWAALNLMPGTMPRYAMPAFAPACILVGWVLAEHRTPLASDRFWKWGVLIAALLLAPASAAGLLMAWRSPFVCVAAGAGIAGAILIFRCRSSLSGGLTLTVATGMLCGLFMLQYLGYGAQYRRQHERLRPMAAVIDDLVPPGQTIYSFRPGYQPALFYIRHGVKFLLHPQEIDSRVQYLLLPKKWLSRSDFPDVADRLGADARVVYPEKDADKDEGRLRLVKLR